MPVPPDHRPFARLADALARRAPALAERLRADPRDRHAQGSALFAVLVGVAIPRVFEVVPEGVPLAGAARARDWGAVGRLRPALGGTGTPEAWVAAFDDLRAAGVVAGFVGSAAWAERAEHRKAWALARPGLFDAVALARVRGADADVAAMVEAVAAGWGSLLIP